MRAIVLEKFGGLDSLVYKDISEPEPKAGHVVIQIKAFGINHAEMHMRRGEWAEAAPVSGIECVGLVKSCPGGEFPVGAKVAAFMGGLGRTINGSYAEYTRAPVSNVALIESSLPWSDLAAIPITYATAWTCLFRNLDIQKGQLLVIRGANSSFGQAAVKMAANAGVRVIATTKDRDGFSIAEKLGAERCEIDRRDLSKHIPEAKKIDAVLDLVGNTVMLDSLAMLRRGRPAQCQASEGLPLRRDPRGPPNHGGRRGRRQDGRRSLTAELQHPLRLNKGTAASRSRGAAFPKEIRDAKTRRRGAIDLCFRRQ
jgi:NADPH2:quinone reductase